MFWYQWLALASLAICLSSCLYHFVKLIRLGKPTDYAKPVQGAGSAVKYSFTGAMSPAKKESAFLHLPTYTAGIIFHIGTFLSIFLFFLILFKVEPTALLKWIFFGLLILSGICGLGILIKRIVKKELLVLSNPDDFISNILVTGLQLITAAALVTSVVMPWYFVWVSLLLLYLPLGKLKHTVYFFAARYHLGFFYGRRGVWPPKNVKI